MPTDMKEPIVIDNFLAEEDFEQITEAVAGPIPWYRQHGVSYGPDYSDTSNDNDVYWTHHFVYFGEQRSELNKFLIPVYQKMHAFFVYRSVVNLYQMTDVHYAHGFHNDCDAKMMSAILYLNTNNGFTLFENGIRVDSIRNRLCSFESTTFHTSVSSTNHQNRMVISMMYVKSEQQLNDHVKGKGFFL